FQPSREVVQGAMEKIADGPDDLVDIEQYIADNTGSDDDSAAAAGTDAATDDMAAAAEGAVSVEADASTETADESEDLSDLLESVADELHGADKKPKTERAFGATKAV